MNFCNLDMRDMVVRLSSSIRVHVNLDVVKEAQNEQWTRYFSRTFRVVHD